MRLQVNLSDFLLESWYPLHTVPCEHQRSSHQSRQQCHISLLIDMGFSAIAIADRVGHESIEITYNYAHLFPSRQTEMAERLDFERTEGEEG